MAALVFALAGALPLFAQPIVSESKFVEVDHLKVHYTNYGKGETALFFVHGWACDETVWADQAPALAEKIRGADARKLSRGSGAFHRCDHQADQGRGAAGQDQGADVENAATRGDQRIRSDGRSRFVERRKDRGPNVADFGEATGLVARVRAVRARIDSEN